MVTYYVVYIFIFASYAFIGRVKGDKQKKNRAKEILLFGTVFILLALRHPRMGTDLGYGNAIGYLHSFQVLSRYSLKEIILLNGYLNYEPGYLVLNKLISLVSTQDTALLLVCALIPLALIGYYYYKKSDDLLFSFVIFLGLPSFLILFSGLRQGIALGICTIALGLIDEKKPVKFIVTVVIASLFHSSAIFVLLSYPVARIRMIRRNRWISLGLLVIVFMFRSPIFSTLARILRPTALLTNSGAITLLIVFVVIYIFCFLLGRDDEENNSLLNIFYLACICQCFAGIYATALRVGYYFMICLPILLPRVINQQTDVKTYKISKATVFLVFVVYGLYSIATTSWAMANPYHFFWELR